MRHLKNIACRLFAPLPKREKQDRPLVWIHAVSLGESKAAAILIKEMRQRCPSCEIALSSVTETGLSFARTLDVEHCFSLPLDFPWTMYRLEKQLNPSLMLFIESDFWPNHLKALKCPKVLVSGKLSERSYRRWKSLGKLSKSLLWKHFDLLLLQDTEQKKRFETLGAKNCHIVPNIKYDATSPSATPLPIAKSRPIITLASTHPGEEKLLLPELKDYTLLIAPRHPHRFEEVANLIDEPYCLYSQLDHYKNERIVLIDTLGALPACFATSDLAIVGGSFVPIGGHNILEPIYMGIPAIYGPHMDAQKEMAQLAEKAGVGIRTTLQTLTATIEKTLKHPKKEACLAFKKSLSGGVEKVFEKIAGEGFEPPTFGL